MSREIPPGWVWCKTCGGYSSGVCPKCGKREDQQSDQSLERVFDDAMDVSSERELQNSAVAWLLLNGAVGLVWHAMDRKTTCFSGVADLVFGWLRGGALIFAAIELKVGRNKTTPAQQDYLDAVAKAGGISAVCRSLEEMKHVLNHES